MSTNRKIKFTTNKGEFIAEMFEDKAPKTTKNFIDLVGQGFYDGLIFHRVIDGFMIQGGGMDENFKEKATRDSIENEADNGLSNDEGTIAMARTQAPHSASAQFFINVKNNSFLNHTAPNAQGWGYAVFGKVVEGTEVVDAIEGVATGSRGFHQDVPREDVVITKATVAE